VTNRRAEGVLLTGVYGSGKSSVAQEVAYLLEQHGDGYALLDLDYLSWAGTGTSDRAGEFALMLQNLAVLAANYRRAGIRLFVLAYFVRSRSEVRGVQKALGLPLRVVRLTAGLPDIEQRLARDVTSGRRDDLREAAAAIAAGEGTGVEDVAIANDRPIRAVAQDVLAFLGWPLCQVIGSLREQARKLGWRADHRPVPGIKVEKRDVLAPRQFGNLAVVDPFLGLRWGELRADQYHGDVIAALVG
jgi:hypothetical protein